MPGICWPRRLRSPSSGSILTTCAPKSASTAPADGTMIMLAASTTRMPARRPGSEEGIATVDEERVACVVAARVAHQVDRDGAEVGRLPPAAHRHARQDPVTELVPVERLV